MFFSFNISVICREKPQRGVAGLPFINNITGALGLGEGLKLKLGLELGLG
jgi:hypothetical protein